MDELKNKSLSTGSGKRNYKKTIISKREYNSRLKDLILVAAVTAGISLSGVSIKDNISDKLVINNLTKEFYYDAIVAETDKNSNKLYYSNIENDMRSNYSDYREAVYLCNKALNDDTESLNKVLKYSEYGNFNNFLLENGYKNKDDFNNRMEKEIILNEEISNDKKEIDELRGRSIK